MWFVGPHACNGICSVLWLNVIPCGGLVIGGLILFLFLIITISLF